MNSRPSRPWLRPIFVLAMALALGACGGSDDDQAAPAASTEPTTHSTSESESTAEQDPATAADGADGATTAADAADSGAADSGAEDGAGGEDDSAASSGTTDGDTEPSDTEPSDTEPSDTEPSDAGSSAGQADAAFDGANPDELAAFLADPNDGPFYMVNFVAHREVAEYPDDHPNADDGLTGAEADAIYGQWMLNEKLPSIGAEIVYASTVERFLIGSQPYEQVAVVRYPSRAAFADMADDADFQEQLVHKDAGIADTVVLATELIEMPVQPEIGDVPYPATDEDRPFAMVHVMDFRETAEYQPGDADADDTRPGREAVQLYSENAGTVATPLGIRATAWFDVKATVIGEPGVWDEVRINPFPSHATFSALTSDEVWQSKTHHRSAGLADTWAILTAPVINEFGCCADGPAAWTAQQEAAQ